jgi:ribose transport system permease protein
MKKKINFEGMRQMVLVFVLVAVCILWTILSPNFLTLNNVMNVIRQASYTAIASVGMTMVIIIGEIDLSAGSVIAASGLLSAAIFKATNNIVLAFGAAILLGIVVGLFNGIICALGKLPGFIATLASMTIIRALGYIITKGDPVSVSSKTFTAIGTGHIFKIIPIPVVIMVVCIAFGSFIMNKTRFGRYVYAVGGNAQASKWSGLNVERVKITVYVIMGVLTSISGIIVAARLGSGQPSAGDGFEMDCITAAVVGGTSMSGGKGKISGTIVGVLLLTVLVNGMTLIDINSYWQEVIKGIIIVVSVLMDTKSKKGSN